MRRGLSFQDQLDKIPWLVLYNLLILGTSTSASEKKNHRSINWWTIERLMQNYKGLLFTTKIEDWLEILHVQGSKYFATINKDFGYW